MVFIPDPFWPCFKGGSFRPNFGGSFRPTLFYMDFKCLKLFLLVWVAFMQF